MRCVDAIRLAFKEYKIETRNPKLREPLPSTSSYGDIVVYRRPYLNWLEMPSNPKIYIEIKDSFKFLK